MQDDLMDIHDEEKDLRDERRKQRPVVPVRAEIRSSRRRVEAFRVGAVIKASHGCRSQGSDGRRQQPRRYHRYTHAPTAR